jgi:hypothetical protein
VPGGKLLKEVKENGVNPVAEGKFVRTKPDEFKS